MDKTIKTKFEFTSPKGSKVTIEREFNNTRSVEDYVLTMAKIGYVLDNKKGGAKQ